MMQKSEQDGGKKDHNSCQLLKVWKAHRDPAHTQQILEDTGDRTRTQWPGPQCYLLPRESTPLGAGRPTWTCES